MKARAAAGLAGLLLAVVPPAVAPASEPAAASALSPASAPAAAVVAPAAAVVVIGAPGLRWDDLSPDGTPTLWRLAGAAAVGSLSVAAARGPTCPVDGWLTLAAGNRARGGAPIDGACAALPPVAAGTDSGPTDVPDFEALARDNRRLDYGTELGALAGALRRTGGCVAAVGPGAALAAAGPDGRVEISTGGPAFAATYTRCAVTVVGVPAVSTDRQRDAAAVDAAVRAVDGARPRGSELLVVGLSETRSDRPRLHLAMAVGARYPSALLTSASTRRPPYVQLIDVAPTVLHDLGRLPPDTMVGQPWRAAGGGPTGTADRVATLADLDRAATGQLRFTGHYFEALVAGQFLLYPLAVLAARRRSGRTGPRALRFIEVAGLACAALLVATFLANLLPWWRAGHPLAALLAAVAVADVAVVWLALAGPWRRHPLGPAGAVAGTTAAVVALDLLTGARLQVSSLAGYSPLVAGRFAGLGNIGFGIFATAVLLLATALAAGRPRRTAARVVALVGAAAVVLDGSPALGSDFGGVLALVPGFALLGMLLTGVRVTGRRLLLAAAGSVLAVVAFALLDYARPVERRTHLGRFVGSLLHGGAATVVRRKVTAELDTLTTSLLTLLVPVAVAILVGVLLRPPRWLRTGFAAAPALRPGLVATLVTAVIAALVNDSGVIIPAVAMTVAIPLAIAVSAAATRARGVTVEFRGRADRPAQQSH